MSEVRLKQKVDQIMQDLFLYINSDHDERVSIWCDYGENKLVIKEDKPYFPLDAENSSVMQTLRHFLENHVDEIGSELEKFCKENKVTVGTAEALAFADCQAFHYTLLEHGETKKTILEDDRHISEEHGIQWSREYYLETKHYYSLRDLSNSIGGSLSNKLPFETMLSKAQKLLEQSIAYVVIQREIERNKAYVPGYWAAYQQMEAYFKKIERLVWAKWGVNQWGSSIMMEDRQWLVTLQIWQRIYEDILDGKFAAPSPLVEEDEKELPVPQEPDETFPVLEKIQDEYIPENQPNAASVLTCKNCGKELQSHQKFCPQCGTKVSA